MIGHSRDEVLLDTLSSNETFVNSLIRHDVRFLVVGGLAVKFYRPEREVDDLDLLVEATPTNAERVCAAAKDHQLQFDTQCLAHPAVHMPIKNYFYLDILTTRVGGEDFDQVWRSSVLAYLGSPQTPVKIPALASLIRMKEEAAAASTDDTAKGKHMRDIRLLQSVPHKKL